MIGLHRTVAVALCMAAALPAAAQSLADVARQEAARRDSVKQAAKAYTNTDLKVDPQAAPISAPKDVAAEAGGYRSISAGRYVSAEEIIANSAANIVAAEKALQEPNWRRMAGTLRGQLLKIQQEAESMASTSADESRSVGERAVAERLLAQKKVIRDDLERRWVKLEKEAEIQRIPRAWLDPRPTLSTQTPQ